MRNLSLPNLIIRCNCALAALLLGACSQLQQPTAAGIVQGKASVMGSAPRSASAATVSKPAPQATPQAIAIASTPPNKAPASSNGSHVVQPGETLYRISVNNGLRYQDVAEWNKLDGFTIKVGQTLRLTPPEPATTAPATSAAGRDKPVDNKPASGQGPVDAKAGAKPAVADNEGSIKRYPKALKLPYSEEAIKSLPAQSEGNGKPANVAAASKADTVAAVPSPAPAAAADEASSPKPAAAGPIWAWPTQGNVIRGYSDQNKGMDIAGKLGQPIVAAADGKVVYSGSGLRGYGKLIILRHDKTYLSAYAHNNQLLVKEGQAVKKGQKIAEMGNTDAEQVKLHFEIRQLGKPVDPSKYLESRP